MIRMNSLGRKIERHLKRFERKSSKHVWAHQSSHYRFVRFELEQFFLQKYRIFAAIFHFGIWLWKLAPFCALICVCNHWFQGALIWIALARSEPRLLKFCTEVRNMTLAVALGESLISHIKNRFLRLKTINNFVRLLVKVALYHRASLK